MNFCIVVNPEELDLMVFISLLRDYGFYVSNGFYSHGATLYRYVSDKEQEQIKTWVSMLVGVTYITNVRIMYNEQ